MPRPVSVKQQLKSALSSHSKRWSQTWSFSTAPSPLISHSGYQPIPLRSSDDWSSPFTRLPLEICAEIFSHCPSDFPRIDAQVPPLTLALVCKLWYHLVTTTPRLWSCFEIVLEGSGLAESEKAETMRRLSLWLERSRRLPLSFRIVHDYTGSTPDMRSVELLALLLPHAWRWQNVQFHGPSGSLAHLPIALPKGSLPALKTMSIHLHNAWDSSFTTGAFRIPWSQLTGLDLQLYQDGVHSLDECFRILSAARNLTWCTLNANCVFTLHEGTGSLALPSLKSLKLVIQGVGGVGSPEVCLLSFLGHLSLSGLRAFTLEWLVNQTEGGATSQWPALHSQLSAFIHSSASSLEKLSLAYLPFTDREIISCLGTLPRLRVLDLKFTLASRQPDPITDELLRYLTPVASLPPLHKARQIPDADRFPLLNSLKLQCSGESLNCNVLLALLEGRVLGQLRTFELMTLKPSPKDFNERLRTWRGVGYDFTASTLNIR